MTEHGIDDKRENNLPRNDYLDEYNSSNSQIACFSPYKNPLKEKPFKRRRFCLAIHRKVDEAVTRWFRAMRERNIYVSGPSIKEHALKFAEMLNIPTFQASNGWLWRWQKRENIELKSMPKPRKLTVERPEWSDTDLSLFLQGSTGYSEEEYSAWLLRKNAEMAQNQSSSKEDEKDPEIIETESDDRVSRSEANTALNVLLYYISANGMDLKNIDEILQHFGKSEEVLSHSKDQEKWFAENEEEQTICTEPSETVEEPEEESQRNINTGIVPSEPQDQFSVYGEHIAHRLRNCGRNDYEVFTAQYNMDEIIYKLCMGGYACMRPRLGVPQNGDEQPMSTGSLALNSFQESSELTIIKSESNV